MTTQFSWLIEAPGPYYLSALPSRVFVWADNHEKAIRFYSAEQADLVMMAVRQAVPSLFSFAVCLRDARPVQHGWMSGSASLDTKEGGA